MLDGGTVRLHRGTVCRIHAPGHDYDGSSCTVAAYDSAKSKWRVMLDSSSGKKEALLLPEASLSLQFCLLPSSVSTVKRHVRFASEAQGACGRGFIAKQHVPQGSLVLEESPLIVVRKDHHAAQRHHSNHFLAYTTLAATATADALAAFDDLTPDGAVPAHLSAAAEVIMAANDDGRLPAEARRAALQQVTDILMRYEANLFTFDNKARDAAFAAAAL